MKSPSTWEDVWEVLQQVFADLAGRLRAQNSLLTWSVNHLESQAFPFTGYIAFNRDGVAGQEDLVVSVGVQRKGAQFLWRSDISLGGGEVLADGPAYDAEDSSRVDAWVEAPLIGTIDFLKEREQLMKEQLCQCEI